MLENFKIFSSEKKDAPEFIHPDFKIKGDVYDYERKLRWQWNTTKLKVSSNQDKYARTIKVAFPFDDPTLLDGCPYMCKLGENIGESHATKYYGVAYAQEKDTLALSEWAQRFPHAKLITDLDPFSDSTTDRSKIEYIKRDAKDSDR